MSLHPMHLTRLAAARDFDVAGERALWRAVLVRALADAVAPVVMGNESVRGVQDAARAWLRGQTADFRMVCELAGYDPAFIRDAWAAGRITAQSMADAKLIDTGATRAVKSDRRRAYLAGVAA